ncbi:Dbl homology domain-containing protein [Sodiomyces alkalinus F11]|uniref:Dbl homology domain-containing protein n=1 Tax=Sodiomyces alkalinus (strain CBS 110278 / VKM F-3762 / F11) TaxID=1314773 RepID=A0A3N2Q029_SODAK|nr:Dbl homology domain-containing protein [Sodiomyces alkalinus F11]ROT40036.1 Dbl homology domain-containing protein [Sodiomyces alkalinus F11]
MADRAAIQRALQRRRILEELISTEEGYIGDVRFLMNVYVTILASLPTSPTGLRPSINRNLTDIVELHEEILGDLHRTVPNSEYTQPIPVLSPPNSSTGIGHRRWRSLDAVPEDKDTHSWLQYAPCITSEAQVAGDVAKIFSRKMSRFFIYEEYGAKYEMMVKDVASAHHKLPQWDAYQRGLEALASSLGAASYHENQSRKSLTIGDLLVKPIQRICRYPLVFAELLRHTPVDDDPNCHMEVENVLLRLREATAEINRATNDSQMRSTLQRTWILQDRLIFANQRIDAASKNRIRSFGHVELCGALYLCWQTKEGVRGQYMVCILYRDVLCLASAGKFEQIYAIEACINLDSIKVEETDNGRGLQCHTAPFSWKLVFECYSQLYEIIMTACTAKEQDEWRSRLNRPIKEGRRVTDPNLYSSLTLGIQSLGTVFSKPGTMARRMAIQRATTVGAKSPLCQVVLKNTSLARDVGSISVNSPLNRSQSLHMNKRIPILAPHRGERTRLETLLSDVWSREVLPFPGITGRLRSEHPVLTTATTMMRKLSVTNIASSLTRRSNSVASTTKSSGNDGIVPGDENHTRLPSIVNENSPNMDEGPFAGAKLEPVSRSTTLLEIPDGSEKRNPTTTSSGLIFQTAEVSGLDRRQCSLYSHGHGDSTLEGMLPAEARALRGSSTDRGFRLRRNKHNSSSSEVLPRTSGKKKKRPTQGAPKKPRLIHRTSSRWGKVGGLNRDTMMRSIRSFFHRGHESHSKDAWKAGVQDGGSPVPYTL